MANEHLIKTPRGCRKGWDRTSVSIESARRFLSEYGGEKINAAVGWFDELGNMRVMVAKTSEDKMITVRFTARHTSISFAGSPSP